jgi:hypothetical protein
MKTRLLSYVIGATTLVEDDEGNFIEKVEMQPVEVFSEEQANMIFTKVREAIAEKNDGE